MGYYSPRRRTGNQKHNFMTMLQDGRQNRFVVHLLLQSCYTVSEKDLNRSVKNKVLSDMKKGARF